MENQYTFTDYDTIPAWFKGYNAYMLGEGLTTNPYHESTDRDSYNDFISGYFTAQSNKEV